MNQQYTMSAVLMVIFSIIFSMLFTFATEPFDYPNENKRLINRKRICIWGLLYNTVALILCIIGVVIDPTFTAITLLIVLGVMTVNSSATLIKELIIKKMIITYTASTDPEPIKYDDKLTCGYRISHSESSPIEYSVPNNCLRIDLGRDVAVSSSVIPVMVIIQKGTNIFHKQKVTSVTIKNDYYHTDFIFTLPHASK